MLAVFFGVDAVASQAGQLDSVRLRKRNMVRKSSSRVVGRDWLKKKRWYVGYDTMRFFGTFFAVR